MTSKMPSKKGQASIELLIVLAVAMIVFLAILGIASSKSSFAEKLTSTLEGNSLGTTMAQRINAVYLAGDTAQTTVYMPASLRSGDYNMSIQSNSKILEMQWNIAGDTKRLLIPLVIGNVTGTLTPATTLTLTNNNGQVVIT